MIWNEARECMSRDELMALQSERLIALVKRMYYSVEYYRRKMQHNGIEPGDIRGIEDLNKLPFTTKDDLQQAAPFELFAVPKSEILRYQISRAATDREILVGCTRNDLEIWAECLARCIHMAGMGKNDTIQIAHSYGFFIDELGVHRGVEKVGASVMIVPMCSIRGMVSMVNKLGVTGIICAPTHLMHLGRMIEEAGEVKKLTLRTAICLAEPLSERMRKDIESILSIEVYNIYGVSELAGIGMACDCKNHNGFHIQEDYFIPEVLHKNTSAAVKDGDSGELVFTTLQRDGMPLIRYRTDAVSSVTRERCECGRTTARMKFPCDKANYMFTVRGVSVLQSEIEAAFLKLYDIHAMYFLRIYIEANIDMIDVLVEMNEADSAFLRAQEEMIRARVAQAVKNVMGIAPNVCLVEAGAIRHTPGRISTVVDERQVCPRKV